MPITAKRIMADRFYRALIDADVIRDGESIRRIVIDIQAMQAVVMYVERWGDERLLDVVPTLDGVEIREGAK